MSLRIVMILVMGIIAVLLVVSMLGSSTAGVEGLSNNTSGAGGFV